MKIKSKGFTLIELVIAIVIISIIASSLYLIIMIGANAWLFAATTAAIYQDGIDAIDYMLKDIRHMEITWYYWGLNNPEASDPNYGGKVIFDAYGSAGISIGEKQHIQFNKGQEFYWAKSYFSTSPASDYKYDAVNKTIVLTYLWGIWNGAGYGSASPKVLVNDVTDLQFSYSGGSYNWASAWQGYGYWTPTFVRVQFTITRGGQSQTFAGTVAVRKVAGLRDLGMGIGWGAAGWPG